MLSLCHNEEWDVIEGILKNRTDIGQYLTETDGDGNTPILVCAQKGALSTMKLMYSLDNNIDFNRQNNNQLSPVLLAAKFGHVHVLRWLKTRKASFKVVDSERNTCTLLAASEGHLEALIWLVEKNRRHLNEKNVYDDTCLILAANGGHLEIIKWIVNKNRYLISDCDVYKQNCAILASINGYVDILEYVDTIDSSLKFSTNAEGASCCRLAVENGQLEVLKWLKSKGVNINSMFHDGTNSSIIAARGGLIDIVNWLITREDYPSHQLNDCLLNAVNSQHIELAKHLVSNTKASLRARDRRGSTCLLLAAYHGNFELMSWLLSQGCSLSEKDNDGDTCLLLACYSGKIETIKWIISQGALITERNDEGLSCILIAAKTDNIELAKWLLDNGASLDDRTNNLDTCLIVAARHGCLDMVKWLVNEKGRSLDEMNIFGTCIMNAALCQKLDVALWMLQNGSTLEENLCLSKKNCEDILKDNGLYDIIKQMYSTKSGRK